MLEERNSFLTASAVIQFKLLDKKMPINRYF